MQQRQPQQQQAAPSRQASERGRRSSKPKRKKKIFATVQLSDFGVARQLARDRTHMSASHGWGTLKYMAPETLHQPNTTFELRKACDVWSLGIILHQMLHNGRTPHEHLMQRGRFKLAFGIFDKRCWRTEMKAQWILDEEFDEGHLDGVVW